VLPRRLGDGVAVLLLGDFGLLTDFRVVAGYLFLARFNPFRSIHIVSSNLFLARLELLD
jgi:hypothetical protein